jgi:hypothetical protein
MSQVAGQPIGSSSWKNVSRKTTTNREAHSEELARAKFSAVRCHMETARIRCRCGQIGGSQYIKTRPCREPPLTPREMIPQVSSECVIKGLFFLLVHSLGFVAPFSRLTPRVRRPVFTSWSPIGTPKIEPHLTPPCLNGMSAGPWQLGT